MNSIILQRVKKTIEIYLLNEGKISDNELANILILDGVKTSSSTVGRDLTGEVAKKILPQEQFDYIQKLRYENKIRGNQKGGLSSNLQNNYIKDEKGCFQGCKGRSR